jgi:hypothetical protein
MNRHTITMDDRSVFIPKAPEAVVLNENILVVGNFPRGITNKMVQLYPGGGDKFREDFGPTVFQSGDAGEIVVDALNNTSGLGVLLFNPAPENARAANAMIVTKYQVVESVQYVENGDPIYIDALTGERTTVADGNEPLLRDVLQLKHDVLISSNVVDPEVDLLTQLDLLKSDEYDNDGFRTIPLVGFAYEGAGSFGNNINLRIVSRTSNRADMLVHDIEMYDGVRHVDIPDNSFFPDAKLHLENIFIERNFNKIDSRVQVISSSYLDELLDLVNEYCEDKNNVNILSGKEFALEVVEGSYDFTAPRAITLSKGTNGDMTTIQNVMVKFFKGEIVNDIDSLQRYLIDIIPDIGFNDDVKKEVNNFTMRRFMTCNFISSLGTNTFESAMSERTVKYGSLDLPQTLWFSAKQNPYRVDPESNRKIRLSVIYWVMKAYINNFIANGNSFSALAGSSTRIDGFEAKSLICPPHSNAYDDLLKESRINVLKVDSEPGAYIASQNTSVIKESDRLEFSNMRILAKVAIDIDNLVHVQQYRLNDPEDVEKFQRNVRQQIYTKYDSVLSGIETKILRKANTGSDRNINLINIRVSFKGLSKGAETTIIIEGSTVVREE